MKPPKMLLHIEAELTGRLIPGREPLPASVLHIDAATNDVPISQPLREVEARVCIRTRHVVDPHAARTHIGRVLRDAKDSMTRAILHEVYGDVREEAVALALMAEQAGLRGTDLCNRLWSMADALTPQPGDRDG